MHWGKEQYSGDRCHERRSEKIKQQTDSRCLDLVEADMTYCCIGDYVNGMLCTVLDYCPTRKILWARTETGKRLPVTPWHDPHFGALVYFPIRAGYCSAVAKVQGDEFPFIVAYLDVPGLPAVGYTALCRVRTAKDVHWGDIGVIFGLYWDNGNKMETPTL